MVLFLVLRFSNPFPAPRFRVDGDVRYRLLFSREIQPTHSSRSSSYFRALLCALLPLSIQLGPFVSRCVMFYEKRLFISQLLILIPAVVLYTTTQPAPTCTAVKPQPCTTPPRRTLLPSFVKQNMEVVYPQVWIFDFDCCTWTCVGAGEGGEKRGNASSSSGSGGSGSGGGGGGGGGSKSVNGPGPPAVFDHTATLCGGKHIIVIGGVMVGTALNNQVRFPDHNKK